MKSIDKISGFFESLTPKALLALSLIFGFLAFFLVFLVLSSRGDNNGGVSEKSDAVKVKVVAAKTDIPLRAEIKEEMLRIVEIPQSAMPDDALKEMVSIVGRPAKVAIMSGDIITSRKLFPDKKAAGFPGMIPEDCRAITLPIDDVTGVAGFALPGDYVDVMLVSEKLQNGSVTGEIVMQNVLLLSINKITDMSGAAAASDGKDKKDGASNPSNLKAIDNPVTATLAVHPEEAMRISVASQIGKIYLALRPFRPTNRYIADTSYSIVTDKKKAEEKPAPTPTPTPAPASARSYSAPANSSSGGNSSGRATAPKIDRGVSSVEVIRGVVSTKE